MTDRKSKTKSGWKRRGSCTAIGCSLVVLSVTAGCNGLPSSKEAASETPKGAPQTYMAAVVGDTNGVTSALQIYTVDDTAETFTQSTSQLRNTSQIQINNSGQVVPLARNLLEMESTYSFPFGAGGNTVGVTNAPPLVGWAVELPDKTGGLAQLANQPVTPLVTAVCPTSSTAQTFQFLTIPNSLLIPPAGSAPTEPLTWNPAVETAYGSVSISGSGGTVSLTNASQSAFSGTAPATAFAASSSGICSSTLYGNTIAVPAQVVIANPGSSETVPASTTIGISASGLLVQSNGANADSPYQNALGAGTGAIGLIKPANALDTSALVAAQYQSFIYGSGNASAPLSFFSAVASFGFSALPSTCASVTDSTPTLIYGGDFPKNDPSAAAVQSGGGFGNCNYAIDLGVQDAANNGFYPAAKIWVGAGFGGNSTGKSYSFPAVAIAGKLAGKFAVFVLGVDTTGSPNQAQEIYLLQSN